MGEGVSPSGFPRLDKGSLRPQNKPGDRKVPTTGMRGGLGRTLLTAFLILAILPIAVTGGYAARQNRRDTEREAGSRLVAVAALKGALLRNWVVASTAELESASVMSVLPELQASDSVYAAWWTDLEAAVSRHGEQSWLSGGAVLDREQQNLVWASDACSQLNVVAFDMSGDVLEAARSGRVALVSAEAGHVPVLSVSLPDRVLLFCLSEVVLMERLASELDGTVFGMGKTGRISLIGGADVWPDDDLPDGERGAAFRARAAGPHYALYQKSDGEAVVGAVYPLPEYGLGVLVEQTQAEVLTGTERVAATLIAWVLTVALGTTWIAATVIRHITRPVLDLTESAVAMAEGDLDQRLPVRSRDEIGILTHVFNDMAAELSSLYQELESKVVERTRRLQEANYQIQRRALYLQASQEVSQAITSVRDPAMLLKQVTELVWNHFVYSSVAIYLLDPGGGEARLYACSGAQSCGEPVVRSSDPSHAMDPGVNDNHHRWRSRYSAGDGSVVGRAIREGRAQLENRPVEAQNGWTSRVESRVAVPMKIAGLGKHNSRARDGLQFEAPRSFPLAGGPAETQSVDPVPAADSFGVVGVIAVLTTAHEGVQADELEVLEALANQVTIALENARAYERERLATEQLESGEAFKARFLANMSHELMEPLNTIMGFSRLLLKGIDGPLNERQREDLAQIHSDGQYLHILIKDILSISELQAGLVELRLQPVNLSELVTGVMPTAGALVRGKQIALNQEIPADLPEVRGDPIRLRQVLVHLLNNAAKFTEAGEIRIRAWTNDGEVYVSVLDTGVGIAREDRSRLFLQLGAGDSGTYGREGRGMGLGLSLCREFVELHGGRIWVDSEVGVGSVFTFSVPVHKVN